MKDMCCMIWEHDKFTLLALIVKGQLAEMK